MTTTLITVTPPIDFRRPQNQVLRAAVLRRDDFTCQHCGWRPPNCPDPAEYTGRYAPEFTSRDLCGDWVTTTLHLDHVWPRHLGGPSVLENLQTLCQSCNARKGHRV